MIRTPPRGPERRAHLTRDLRRVIKRGHPWVFSDAVKLPAGAQAGDVVALEHGGRIVARGYCDPEGPLAVRILSTDPNEVIGPETFWARLDRAIAWREALFAGTDTDGYRLVNGEGDRLPGLVIDRYRDTLVIKPDGPVAERFWDTQALAARLVQQPGVVAIYARARSRGGAVGETLRGEVSGPVTFSEHGALFEADVREGQKTGFFLDQREHRLALGRLARDRRVLNAFAYTGGFSVQCGRHGARHVTTLDLAAPALAAAEVNWRKNGLPDTRHRAVTADTFAFLGEAVSRGETFDLVILDPPAFAPSRKDLEKALAAYTSLAELGARVTAPSGLLFLASCSLHVRRDELMGCLDEGLARARRAASVVSLGGQPPDHPYPLGGPELAYLKTALVRVE